MGKQFVQPGYGVCGNAGEHIVEPRARLNAAPDSDSKKAKAAAARAKPADKAKAAN